MVAATTSAKPCEANRDVQQIGTAPALAVSGLTVSLRAKGLPDATIVNNVSFQIDAGEVLGVLGESGAGKSTLALALLRLLPPAFAVNHGSIKCNGRETISLSERELRNIRGAQISMVPQDPSVLNPLMRAEEQVAEVLHAHRDWPMRRCRDEAKVVLDAVGLAGDRLHRAYSHQLSGGQRQRVAIAQAIACRPGFVIADEPTASLDAVTSREILTLLSDLKSTLQTSFLLISHDPSVLRTLADRVMVMYAGQVVEEGPVDQVFGDPLHPYTRDLLRCDLRRLQRGAAKQRLPHIPGAIPDNSSRLPVCQFENRCADRLGVCRTVMPELVAVTESRKVHCLKYGGAGQ